MKSIIPLALLVSLNCYADNPSHWSAGVGSNYGGVGVKYSHMISSDVDLYANIGHSALFAVLGLKNGIAGSLGSEFALDDNQYHSLHAAFMVMDGKDFSYSDHKDKNFYTGYGFGYTYYFSGMQAKGQALGVTRIRMTDDGAILQTLSISWGYRF